MKTGRCFWLALLGLAVLPTPSALADQAADVLLGNGTAGPYALSWKKFAAGTEAVRVNSQDQTRGLDYTVDVDAGTITFTHPLPAQSAAEVRYDYDPGHAVHGGGGLTLPLAFDLARTEHGSLSLNAQYKANDLSAGGDAGLLTVGLGGGWQTGSTQIATRLLFAPSLNASQSGGSSLDRAGLSLSGTTDVSPATHLSFGFARAGQDLAGMDGWQRGTQTLSLGGSLTPSKQMLASVDYTQADSLSRGGHMTARLATGFTLAPASSLKLQTHWTEQSTQGSADESGDISLSARPSDATQVDASFSALNAANHNDHQSVSLAVKETPAKTLEVDTHLAQNSTSTGGTTQVAGVTVAAQPLAATQINATFASQDAPGVSRDTQTLNLGAKITPNNILAVTAEAGQMRLGNAATDQQQLALALTPISQVQLQTGVVLRQTSQYQTTAASLNGKLQPASYLQLSASYTRRIAPAADPTLLDGLDSSAAQVALSPWKGLNVTGHYTQNPDNGGTPQRLAQRGVGLQTVFGCLSLSGGYDWSRQYDTPTVGTTLNLGLGLRLSQALQITGGYKQTLVGMEGDPTGTSLYSFGLTHNLGDRFNLSMTGTMQQQVGQTTLAPADYTATANLGMKF